jgi:ABC-type transport system involved in multi-copper enzyme maturation permease subunit
MTLAPSERLVQTPMTSKSSTASIQTHHERVGDLSAVAGLMVLVVSLFFLRVQWWQAPFLVLVCFAPAFILNRVGWLKVFGPVFYYDLVRQSRRGRLIVLRLLYCCILFGVLVFMVAQSPEGSLFYWESTARNASVIAETYFQWFLTVQFVLVTVLTPAFVAGSIAEENERQTLEFMAATDLLNREIVLSKLGSRLATLTLLVMTGLPFLAILQFVGAIDPNLVLAGYACTLLAVLGESGVSIFCSVLCRRQRDAIGLAYVIVVSYYALTIALNSAISSAYARSAAAAFAYAPANESWVLTIEPLIELISTGSLLTVLDQVRNAAAIGTLAAELPRMVSHFAIFHGCLALGCIALAVAEVRRFSLSQKAQPAKAGFSHSFLSPRPSVGPLPMLWKEVYRAALPRPLWLKLGALAVVLAVTVVPLAMVIYNSIADWDNIMSRGYLYGGGWIDARSYRDLLGEYMTPWVRSNTLVVGIFAVLAVGVRAASSILSEREKDTWDTLISTPVECLSVLKAKWAGSILGARWGLFWLAAVLLLALLLGGMHPGTIPFFALAWLSFSSLVAVIGLWFSTRCKTSLRAIMATMLCTLFLLVIHRLIWLLWDAYLLAFVTGSPVHERVSGGMLAPFDLGYLDRSYDIWERGALAIAVIFTVLCSLLWVIVGTVIWASTLTGLKRMANRSRKLLPLKPSYR